ncbi:hypothetical protein DFA_01497 [Cavenderia fasciculata]|uniref:Uncharacterized protein n=1 Tax=Cavenderia fasciculata TaxID=261658 RepID=F4PT35_CACFS|nr:uncharacterized protein DFA_01497 [Cavenderia fasciculata]EGG21611.1 hypothetical protein DFA_01497 [Cavenderia fasciculata]|eukprot:XP_004359461.1 hypothetical protein DFA_01497 [Cavenderia fasciculata]
MTSTNNNNNKNVVDEESSSDVEIVDQHSLNGVSSSSSSSSVSNLLETFPQFICTDIKNVIIGYLSEIGIDNALIQSLNNQFELKIDNQYTSIKQQQQHSLLPTTTTTPIPIKKEKGVDQEEEKNINTTQLIDSNLTLLSKLNSIYHVTNQKRVNGNKSRFKRQKITSAPSQVQTISGAQQQQLNKVEVQIQAPREEISKRIQSFISRKKIENSEFNTRVFRAADDGQDLAARVTAGLPQRIKSSITVNTEGPATATGSTSDGNYVPYVNERCSIIEDHIGVLKPIPTEIYSRVKKIEDKIVEIEQKNPAFFREVYDQRIQKQKSNRTIVHQSSSSSTTTTSIPSPPTK